MNPFDETFRRAVESECGDRSASYDHTKDVKPKLATQTTLEALTMHNEETLHTPNVMPYLESTSSSEKILKSAISLDEELLHPIEHSTVKSEPMQVVDRAQTDEKSKNAAPASQTLGEHESTAKRIILVSAGVTPYLVPISDPKPTARPLKKLIPKKAPIQEHPVKEKLKQLILHARNSITTATTTTTTTTVATKTTAHAHPSIARINQLKSKPQKHSSAKGSSDLFERNRAAAQRYRVKVKKTQNWLRQRNAELEAENEKLKAELNSIKLILVAHQDCSVTRASNQRIIAIQTQCTIQGESKILPIYLVDDNKTRKC